jgi:hypothetical protein
MWKYAIIILVSLSFSIDSIAYASQKPGPHIPLIIMGGRWSETYREKYSDLSRVCNAGFTHVFSFSTESSISARFAPQSMMNMVNLVVELAALVQRDCPDMGLVVGIPRAWIYEERSATIKQYILAIEERGIPVDYWFSDEMILQMVRSGLSLEKAVDRARKAVETVKEVSDVPYIWNEAGRYNDLTKSIIGELARLDSVAVKAFDEYIISKKGRLTQSGLSSVRNTLKILKGQKNIVFPVCEINRIRGIEPGEEDLATELVTLLMDGADGFLFYEERLSTPAILQRLGKINKLLAYLQDAGVRNFQKKTDSRYTVWIARLADRVVYILFNSGTSVLETSTIIPERAVIQWPLNAEKEYAKSPLKAMEIRVVTEEVKER